MLPAFLWGTGVPWLSESQGQQELPESQEMEEAALCRFWAGGAIEGRLCPLWVLGTQWLPQQESTTVCFCVLI